MSDDKAVKGQQSPTRVAVSRWRERGILCVACVLVITVYVHLAPSGVLELLRLNAADAYYNLLVQGFRAGQLDLKREVPPVLAQLANPQDPSALSHYGALQLHDLSYYKGRLYLYFGITPALTLFWPYAVLSGQYLSHRQATIIFCAIGFLASVGLLHALWRRYFAEVSVGVVTACVLALGLATGMPVLFSRAEVYEVAISCGSVLTVLALSAIWCAFHDAERSSQWLAAASFAYGLAVGARPSLLFGAVILLVPVVRAWCERREAWSLLVAAIGPIILIGLGLMLYNAARFDSPFEFGMRYQLAPRRPTTQFFSLHYLWFNFRVYFLKSVRWSCRFPFIKTMVAPPLPPGHSGVERPFGILVNVPLVWLALAAPFAWRARPGEAASRLRWFAAVVAVIFGSVALTICLYYYTVSRFEVEFLFALVLLAVIGILGLERLLIGQAIGRRRVVRWVWGGLLSFSVGFNLLASIEHRTATINNMGVTLAEMGKMQEAIGCFEQSLRLDPDFAEAHYNLASALGQVGQFRGAIEHFEQALRLKPTDARAHANLGIVLAQLGRRQEAMAHWEQALRLDPDDPGAHYNLGLALEQAGRTNEAIGHFEQAVAEQTRQRRSTK